MLGELSDRATNTMYSQHVFNLKRAQYELNLLCLVWYGVVGGLIWLVNTLDPRMLDQRLNETILFKLHIQQLWLLTLMRKKAS